MGKPFAKLFQHPMIRALRQDKLLRLRVFALLSFGLNALFALFYGGCGIYYGSDWFVCLGVYYLLLGSIRLYALTRRRQSGGILWRTGILFVLLTLVFAAMSYMSVGRSIGTSYGTIPMITIAAYTFFKITAAILRAVRKHHIHAPSLRVIAMVGYAEIAVSVMAMQRSMLATFEGMSASDILVMNAATAGGVFVFILWLGFFMIGKGIDYARKERDKRNGKG